MSATYHSPPSLTHNNEYDLRKVADKGRYGDQAIVGSVYHRGLDDEQILETLEKATALYKFCPNRIWSIASSHSGKEHIVPVLINVNDIYTENLFAKADSGDHTRCTFDFCEHSQINFASVSQHVPCGWLKNLFPRDVLNKGAEKGMLTAWYLNGRALVQPGQKFMAISHVWSDGTRAGTWPTGEVNNCLYGFFWRAASQLGCDGIWWDALCIPSEKDARAKALKRMHRNYELAEVTLVHDCFLRSIEWVDGETACLAILMSPWFSRGWTALELAKSRKVKVAFRKAAGTVFMDQKKK
ncbi:MAG: hypothetical protein M1820_008928 [Bogoriella megaspora]|nr:MAG: hypothetical protein M1820_008928 [Bogoriella megaspora]